MLERKLIITAIWTGETNEMGVEGACVCVESSAQNKNKKFLFFFFLQTKNNLKEFLTKFERVSNFNSLIRFDFKQNAYKLAVA